MPRLVCTLLLLAISASAQTVTWSDYERASHLRDRYQGRVTGEAGNVVFLDNGARFYYRRAVLGGNEFVMADSKTGAKKPAFDQTRLAQGLSNAAGEKYTAVTLPFLTFTFVDGEKAITFAVKEAQWRCELADYSCKRANAPAADGGRPRAPQADASMSYPAPRGEASVSYLDAGDAPEGVNHVEDGILMPPDDSAQAAFPQAGRGGRGGASTPTTKTSPDGKWEAVIRNFNVALRAPGATDITMLSTDGSEGNYYTFNSIAWSPDSAHLVAYRVRPGYHREVHYVRSSPEDQLQPKLESTTTLNPNARDYAKPGDALDFAQPVLFDVGSRKQHAIDNRLFPNPYNLTRPEWRKNSRAFTFEYNQRGHQVYRVIEVDAQTAQTRGVITETSKTFIYYNRLLPAGGRTYRHDVADGAEVIWMSERDGWAHLYLYDGVTGALKTQITHGDWVVRAVDNVDDEKRQIWFQASGMYPGKDPYFTHTYRINFDGTGLTPLTEGDGNHTPVYSPDGKYIVDTWSRVDKPPVMELRSAIDGKLIAKMEESDASALTALGWKPPEVFVAPGRDGKTEIWGLIYRPANFDPKKKYPVVEEIYAGPHGSFVPKSFGAMGRPGSPNANFYAPTLQVLTELGFIVVRMDGMGTSNRSKAFNDVAWKNIKDAGFPDRIAWIQAAAKKYPYMDATRVGIFGTSAGGQNAMGGLLFHPDFYKAGIANSGCHDNRMDKIWWNEQWMGWPIGPEYAESSNVDNAYRLKGKLLLVVPELDTNVDPSSTVQVVNALMKANKKFDFLMVPGGDHGAGGRFGQRLMFDFFVHNLLGAEPPEWQAASAADEAATERVPN